MKLFNKYLQGNTFLKNIMLLVSGTLLAQIISIVSSPILTRVYTPSDFGEYGVFTSFTSILSVFVCLRYEMALVIPKEKKQAIAIYVLSLLLCVVNSLIVAIVLFFCGVKFYVFLGINANGVWGFLLPIYIFFSGVFSINNYWFTREGKFKSLARRQIIYMILIVTIEIVLSFFLPKGNGLGMILGATIALTTTSFILIIIFFRDNFHLIKMTTFKDLKREAFKYKEFPLFSSWTAIINTLSFSLPTLMLTFYYSTEVVGCYNLSYKILDLPISLVGGAVAQAFYPQLNSAENFEKKRQLTIAVFNNLLELGFVPLMLLSIAAPWIFSAIFGSEWIMTGYYTRLLSLWLLVVFVSSPISNLYVVMKKQKEGLIMNVLMLIFRFISLSVGGQYENPMVAIGLFGLTGAILWMINNIYIMSFVNIGIKEILAYIFVILKRGVKYLILPMLSLLLNNYYVFIISFLCGLWFVYDYLKKYKRLTYDYI